jgi:hypothetical protein
MAISRSDMERQLRNMGGIMSLEEPRQGYLFGGVTKAVKKAVRGVKKIAKSPVGKAAILGALTFGIPGTQFGGLSGGKGLAGLKGKLFGMPGVFGPPNISRGVTPGLLGKLGLTKGGGAMSLTGLGKIAGITGLSGLAGLAAAGEVEDEDEIDFSQLDRGEGLNILDIVARARKNDPEFRFLPGAEFTDAYAADGGRIGKEEGGGVGSLAMNKENVQQMYVSDEAGALPKKMKDGEAGVLPSDMGKLKKSDFETEEDYKRYLRQLNRKAKGGITELDAGAPDIKLKGDVKPENMKMARSNMMNKRRSALQGAFEMALEKYMSNNNVDVVPIDIQEGIFNNLQRKMLGRAEGGLMNLDGLEMDLRGGGFVPLGAKEKADDVPARLSKNEFVMTADAVRAAGGGSVDKGADKMYNMMKNLEAKV